MTTPNEETLMAYADDALSPEQRRAVDTHLASTPSDRALVEQFKRSKELSLRALEDVDMQPRAALVELLRSDSQDADAVSEPTIDDAATIIPFLKTKPRRVSVPSYALPLAAGLALLIGFGGGYAARNVRDTGQQFAIGAVPSGTRLAAFLDTEKSGAPSTRQPDLQITATFYDRMKRPCREIERLQGGGSSVPTAAAIACRDSKGWVIEGAARTVASVAPGVVRPSGTQDRDALGSILDRLGANASLSRGDEQRLIDQKWR